jgi:hypothetical protein
MMAPTKLALALACIHRSVQRSALASPPQPAIEVRLLPHPSLEVRVAWLLVEVPRLRAGEDGATDGGGGGGGGGQNPKYVL